MRRYVVIALLLISVAAQAMPTLRVGDKVLSVGDSAARVQELLGPPAVRTYLHRQDGSLPNDQVSQGEQWQYVQEGKTVTVTIVDGKATDFQSQPN
ncbi:DUF2845 domain-containing protein [Dyella acidisoli]|uniref:DUF2845 domain-containing protein n=1 Tax=Dyella acidisoli TaxID=1867834 RepID=A0ABQ5XXB0_9GAMM|nr:DUF2845 domain-containing protein [Dyella acidisoli]GLQ95040.1 hypothetical protein GCM10007901_39930 [Dyella acidisoli]